MTFDFDRALPDLIEKEGDGSLKYIFKNHALLSVIVITN